jgi:hypothetical protein
VTLLIACPTGDGNIVIGADTRTIDFSPPLIWSSEAKLNEHPEASLMWGYSGHVGTGTQFVENMTVNGPPSVGSWERFLDGAKAHLHELNEDRYKRDRSGERIGALFGGFLNSEPGIVRIDFTDFVSGPTPLAMRAIGSVETMAHEIWDHSATDMSVEAVKHRIGTTFETICNERALSIGPPWDIFEVTPMTRRRLTPEWP